MTEPVPVVLVEDGVPFAGIEQSIGELVEMYGGSMKAERENAREFTLPLRRGMASGGAVGCTVTWRRDNERDATVELACDRDIDAPKGQRILLLVAGVIGALLFMIWPFFPGERAFGTLAWLGGIVAIAVYLMTLRKTSGGLAADFLRRLADRQRAGAGESGADDDAPTSPSP